MKKILLVLLLSFPTVAQAQTWAFVADSTEVNAASASNIVVTLDATVTATNLVVCHFGIPGTAQTIDSVDGNISGAYTEVATGSPITDATAGTAAAFYKFNASADTTVTATLSGAVTNRLGHCTEYSGIATASAFDVSAGQCQSNPATTTDAVSSTATAATAEANELIWSGTTSRNTGTTISAGTNFTLRELGTAGSIRIEGEDRNQATAAAVTGLFTHDTSGADFCTIVAAFKGTASGFATETYYRSQQ